MMQAGKHRFKLTWSSLYHLWIGGTRLAPDKHIVIPRVILLLDVSKWQGDIDFVKMKSEGVDGVIIKCGQGTTKDPKFDQNWRNAKAAGMLRGTYWFYDSRFPPSVQAFWWNEWTKHDRGELPHAGDYEESYGGTYRGWQNFKIFLTEFQRVSSLPNDRIVIYTGYYYWIANSPTNATELAWFGRFALWEAWYTSNPANVIIPKPWNNTRQFFFAWQYGTPPNGHKYGAESIEVDENNYNGDEVEYHERYGGEPIPPDNGGYMFFKVLVSLNARSSPENLGGANDIGDLFINDIVETPTLGVVNAGVTWRQVTRLWRNGFAVALPVSPTGKVFAAEKGGSVYMQEVQFTPPDTTSPIVSIVQETNFTAKTVTITKTRKDGTSQSETDPIE